ncbi:MAG: hypothetical protein OEM49_15920 [Myxococcales bacterium]|nr:hypothetical protein [Myxococcales bacterium]MDH5566948.1 hypothetical protein [Myxococcales bacterium]
MKDTKNPKDKKAKESAPAKAQPISKSAPPSTPGAGPARPSSAPPKR